jgi:hypothetical protein
MSSDLPFKCFLVRTCIKSFYTNMFLFSLDIYALVRIVNLKWGHILIGLNMNQWCQNVQSYPGTSVLAHAFWASQD